MGCKNLMLYDYILQQNAKNVKADKLLITAT